MKQTLIIVISFILLMGTTSVALAGHDKPKGDWNYGQCNDEQDWICVEPTSTPTPTPTPTPTCEYWQIEKVAEDQDCPTPTPTCTPTPTPTEETTPTPTPTEEVTPTPTDTPTPTPTDSPTPTPTDIVVEVSPTPTPTPTPTKEILTTTPELPDTGAESGMVGGMIGLGMTFGGIVIAKKKKQ